MSMVGISYRQWMLETGLGHFRRRSKLLQDLDRAIRRYDQEPTEDNAFGIRNSFNI